MARRLSLRRAVAVTAALSLCGLVAACSDTDSDYAKIGSLVYGYVAGNDGVPLSKAAEIPFATLGVNLGSSPQAIFVLATTNGGDRMWLAGKQAALVTRDNRVIHTTGFLQNLVGLRDGPEIKGGNDKTYFYDLTYPNVYNVLVRCVENDVGPEQISILGSQLNTRHVVEHCVADTPAWSFDNEYWRDPDTGFAWRSIQYFHPKQSPLTIEVFRPPTEGQ